MLSLLILGSLACFSYFYLVTVLWQEAVTALQNGGGALGWGGGWMTALKEYINFVLKKNLHIN